MAGPSPPRLARWILRLLVRREIRQEVEGDLEELFRRRAQEDGRWSAAWAYWRQILSPTLLRLRQASAGVSPTRGAPIASRSGDPVLGSLARDLSYGLRILGRSPGFTAVAVLSIALGIGPNTAVFTLVNELFFGDRGVADPGRVVQVYNVGQSGSYLAMSRSKFDLIREGTGDVLSEVMAFTNVSARLGDEGDRTALIKLVTANYFDALGVRAGLGRTFLPEEDVTPGTHPVVVLSHRLWQSEYGGDPGVAGSEIRLNGRPYTVVGVAPGSYRGRFPGIGTDLWAPYMTYPHLSPGQPRKGNLWTQARVRDGVPVERAVAAVDALAARIDRRLRASGETNRRFRLEAWPLTEFWFQSDLDRPIIAMASVLLGAVFVVLLIACTNLAGFLLARATDRRKEMAFRSALGAGRSGIVRQQLVESLILAAGGGGLGLLLGALVVRGVLAVEPPVGVPLNLHADLDARVLAFTAGATLLAALVFGLAPSLKASRADIGRALRDESAGSGQSAEKQRTRNLLVAAQMGLSVVLLVGAGLFIRSLRAATSMDPGFDTGPAGIVAVNAGASGYPSQEIPDLNRTLLREAKALPGVESVAATNRLPLELGQIVRSLDVPGVPPPEGRDAHALQFAIVNPDYFRAMGIEIVRGRSFRPDEGPEGPRSVLLSRAAARRFWPDQDPVGKVMYQAGDPSLEYRVVGITDNVKIWSLTEPDRPYMYVSVHQDPESLLYLVARGERPPAEMAHSLREMVRRVDPQLYVPEVKTMEDHLGFILFLPRMGALLLSGFGLLALVLSSVGLYGLVSYSVARRTREVGIRIALGADRRKVLAMAMKGGLVLAALAGR